MAETLPADEKSIVQAQSEFNCECGSPFVKLEDNTFVCAKTVERFEALHGYKPGKRKP